MSEMKDKICIVTGANSGIGKVTAIDIAKKGAKLIMVCRSKERGQEALDDVVKLSGNENVELMLADMSSQKSILEFTKSFKEKYDRIDVLLNNAGLIVGERKITEDGFESTFATNHMGYFLTTKWLMDIIKESKSARIVNVASEAHRAGDISFFNDINCEKGYNSMRVYGQSKLYNIIFTYELDKRLKADGVTNVTANCLHPGVIASNFGSSGGTLMKFAVKLARPFLQTNDQGAETQIYLSTSPDVEGISGKYFDKKRPVKSSRISYDEKLWEKLWEISENSIKINNIEAN